MIELVNETLHGPRSTALTTELICELHGLAMTGLVEHAGTLRQADVRIRGSRHEPPASADVPRLVEDLCGYCNASRRDAIHNAAYALWRLAWIHPFAPDGNGRTARAVAMFVLFARLRATPISRPDRPTFLEVLGWRKHDCIDALEAADAALARGACDVSQLEHLLMDVLRQSLTRGGDAAR